MLSTWLGHYALPHSLRISVASLRPNQLATIIVFVSLTASAFFLAQGATGLAAAKLLALDPSVSGSGSAGPGRTPPLPGGGRRRSKSPVQILGRNIFEMPEDTPAPEAASAAQGPAAMVIPGQEPPCGGDIRLVGAVVHPVSADLSYAALVQGQTPARLYRTGMSFAGKNVLAIDYDHVLLADAGGSACKVSMFGVEQTQPQLAAAPAAPAAAPATTLGPAQPEGELSADEIERGIQRISDTSFNVTRQLLDRALLAQGSLFRTARLIPQEENGRVVGMKIYGIRRSSLLGRLGVQNGDTLRTINGFDLTSGDSMVEAYTRLRTQPDFSLAVVRRGEPATIEYHVR